MSRHHQERQVTCRREALGNPMHLHKDPAHARQLLRPEKQSLALRSHRDLQALLHSVQIHCNELERAHLNCLERLMHRLRRKKKDRHGEAGPPN